jgi:hypothetical protein
MTSIHAPGARWVRIALQINPFEYVGANPPSARFESEDAYNAALVSKLTSLNVELIAVTDHWNAHSARGLLSCAAAEGIVALPGFEANTSEGVHVLVIFPETAEAGAIDAAIGECGGTPKDSGKKGRPFSEVVAAMKKRGALVIAAHVNAGGGLLIAGGGSRQAMWRHDDLAAAAVSPGVELSAGDQSIIENRDSTCKRSHPLAIVHADDICHPDRLAKVGGTSWIKLSTKTLASLAMALRAPETRVSIEDPTTTSHPTIKSISWQGGFLDNLELFFSESLTSMIGGRGTGKSTVIESIRYALDLPPITKRAAADHDDFVNEVLKPATRVSLVVETTQPVRTEYTIERTVPDPPVVRDAAGRVLAQSPLDVLGQVEIFSQHELAELADDRTYVAELLGRFAGVDPGIAARADAAKKLAENRKTYLDIEQRIEELEGRLAELPKLKEQLDLFEEQGVDGSLKQQQLVQREGSVLTSAGAQLDKVDEAIAALDLRTLLDASFVSEEATSEMPRATTLREIAGTFGDLAEQLDTGQKALRASLEVARLKLAATTTTWIEATQEIRDQYETVMRNLQEAGLDAPKYLALGGRIEELENAAANRARLDEELEQLHQTRLQLMASHGDLELAARQRLNEAAKEANSHVKGLVVVKPVRSSDRSKVQSVLISHTSGQRTQIMAAVNQDDFSPRAFVAACREGAETLESRYAVRGAQNAALIAAGEGLYLELEEQQIGLAAEAQLNVATTGAPVWKSLDNLSKGQKATALLLLLLTDSTAPLIIDQPEDNLDNAFVYKGIVPRVRELKGTRQLIVATHNANIPVLGDAELVIALEAEENHGVVAPGGVGSIDDEHVRGLAGDLLEGGREAFDARRHVYGY